MLIYCVLLLKQWGSADWHLVHFCTNVCFIVKQSALKPKLKGRKLATLALSTQKQFWGQIYFFTPKLWLIFKNLNFFESLIILGKPSNPVLLFLLQNLFDPITLLRINLPHFLIIFYRLLFRFFSDHVQLVVVATFDLWHSRVYNAYVIGGFTLWILAIHIFVWKVRVKDLVKLRNPIDRNIGDNIRCGGLLLHVLSLQLVSSHPLSWRALLHRGYQSGC